jgi:hypothetical protein
MIFRRIILETEKLNLNDIETYVNSTHIKLKYNEIKIIVKQSLKPNVFILDLRGEGADGLSKKLKNYFQPYCPNKVQIKKEIKLIPKK